MISNKNFYVYGASLFGQAVVDHFLAQGITPTAIIDAFPKTDSYRDVEIIQFSTGKFDFTLPVFVTILGYDGVEESIRFRGFESVFDAYEVFKMFPDALRELNKCGFLWMKEPAHSQWSDEHVATMSSLLSDQKSVQLLDKIISYRKNPCFEHYPVPESYMMYDPVDVPSLYEGGDIRVLDIGAYDGDTYKMFYGKYSDRIKAYCAVEASPLNVQRLQQTVSDFPLRCDVKILHGAVGLPPGKKLLIHENKSASTVKVVDAEEFQELDFIGQLVPNISLFDFPLSDYNFVKMDIEGADFPALKQMSKYIECSRPNLALSVYHTPTDLWEIPLYLDDLSSNGYKFYLRQEGHWLFETQLYAVRK